MKQLYILFSLRYCFCHMEYIGIYHVASSRKQYFSSWRIIFNAAAFHIKKLHCPVPVPRYITPMSTLPDEYTGTVDNAVDATTGTILMKARLSNDDEKLTPGQFVNVALLLDTLPHAVVVPKEAVQQGAEGNFIYVVKDDNSVEVRKVEIAAADSGMAAIGKGLQWSTRRW